MEELENERNQYEWKLKATKVKGNSYAYGETLRPSGECLCLNSGFAGAHAGKMQTDPTVCTRSSDQVLQQRDLTQEGSSQGGKPTRL